MPDKISLPRSFFGNEVGAADVLPSLKRKYLTIPIPMSNALNSTTGNVMGGPTRGGFRFARPATIEAVSVCFFTNNTTSHATKHLQVGIYKNATAAFATPVYGTTGALLGATSGWKRKAMTLNPLYVDFSATDRLSVALVRHVKHVTRIAVFVQYVEKIG